MPETSPSRRGSAPPPSRGVIAPPSDGDNNMPPKNPSSPNSESSSGVEIPDGCLYLVFSLILMYNTCNTATEKDVQRIAAETRDSIKVDNQRLFEAMQAQSRSIEIRVDEFGNVIKGNDTIPADVAGQFFDTPRLTLP